MVRSDKVLVVALLGLFAAVAARAEEAPPGPAKTRVATVVTAEAPAEKTTAAAPAEKPKPAKPRKKVDPVTTAAIGPIPAAVPYRPPQELINWYAERGAVSMPRGDRLVYCHGFECRLRTTVAFDESDRRQVEAIFATRRGSAAEERDAIDHLVQWWEKRAAPLLGGPPDIRGSEPGQANKPGQTDCLDEATNSTTVLVWAQQQGLLRYHSVIRPESRGGLLYAHATAVYEEVGGKAWVVDSWMRDSGDPNDVMPLDEWLEKW